jgi:hypothetical protein
MYALPALLGSPLSCLSCSHSHLICCRALQRICFRSGATSVRSRAKTVPSVGLEREVKQRYYWVKMQFSFMCRLSSHLCYTHTHTNLHGHVLFQARTIHRRMHSVDMCLCLCPSIGICGYFSYLFGNVFCMRACPYVCFPCQMGLKTENCPFSRARRVGIEKFMATRLALHRRPPVVNANTTAQVQCSSMCITFRARF